MEKFFKYLWENLSDIYPPIFWAILVFLVGYFISRWIGLLASRGLKRIKLNQILRAMGWEEAMAKAEIKLDAEKFFGKIVKWFFIILVLMLTFEILGLKQFSGFLEKVLGYYPNIFIACLLFLVAVFLTNFSKKILIGTLEREKITYSGLLGKWVSLGIWTITILAILYQLRIVPEIILTVLIGFVIAFALTIGISFGLGGKDLAAKFLKEFEEKIKK
ncbi:hypothetical protein AMJ49_00200 [Parcubacteria bacterium DG_74_2]|nr:MAG: hypothetical protein AMJ49_00200 [Parcubacteria bacterium DG_74_2]